MSVTSATNESAHIAMPLISGTVVGQHLFYNNSRFDGNNPALNQTDDTAIATNKTALRDGQSVTFANYSSFEAGINGVMVDIAGLTGTPTLDDFAFRVGNSNILDNWVEAPQPVGFSVRPGDGVGGSTRITITWADGTIRNKWLQVTVQATDNTGLAQADYFYFGSAVGDTGNSRFNALVNANDQLRVRSNPRGASNPAPITSPYDFNRDGLVDSTDELISRTTYSDGTSRLLFIAPEFSGAGSIAGRHVFYNNSSFDGNNTAANAADDSAIATDKTALLPGGTASFANYTSYSRGINGIMIDIAGLTSVPSLSNFEFRMGNNDFPDSWSLAPQPASLSVRWGAGVGGSARVTLTWTDGEIVGKWLQVTVNTAVANLLAPDVFYFGNAVADIGNSLFDARITSVDYLTTTQSLGAINQPITSHIDYDRDGAVTSDDVNILVAAASTTTLDLIELIAPEAPLPSPAETSESPAFMDFVKVDVVMRGLFYNNSQFDGINPAITSKDDQAIATDKSGLLPGQTATMANYSSYSRGINGLFIDIAGSPSDLTAADFEFRVGNNGDPSTWTLAPAPLQVLSRHGAGVNGALRVMVVWQDNVMQNTWLQVTLKSTAATGLQKDDVFYFGNLIGDAGNNITRPLVNSLDQISTRNQAYTFITTAPITHLADYNRDGLVNFSDEWTSARNQGRNLFPLVAPASNVALEPELPNASFFHYGDSGVFIAFATNLVRTNDGTILYIAEARTASYTDESAYGIVMKRSFDNGATWTPMSFLYQDLTNVIQSPSVVVDKVTGEVFLLFIRNASDVFVMSSTNSGNTWSTPVNITNSVKVTSAGNPNPAAFPNTPWSWYVVGSGHGIQLEQGAYAGRLVITGDHRISIDRSGPSWSHIIYSDDHGRTWKLGGGLNQSVPWNANSNENTVVEQSDGTLYMNIRDVRQPYRAFSRSYDGGATWTNMQYDAALLTSSVHASVLRVNENTLVFSAPDSSNGGRQRMTIWISYNDGFTWTKTKAVFYGYASYSDMVLVGDDTVLLAFNSGRNNQDWLRQVTLVRFNLRWLTEPGVPQFTWQFAEKAPGERAELGNGALIDDSIWDNRATAVSSWFPEAPQYVEGPNGRTALRLTSGVDMVTLSPSLTMGLQLEQTDSITVEMTLRTTATSGVIIGSRPGIIGWSVRLENGAVAVTLDDLNSPTTVTSNVTINDGNWHRIVVVRNASTKVLTLIIDGVHVATGTDTTIAMRANADAIMLGAYNNATEQLAFDIDVLRVTRSALSTAEFIPVDLPEPPRWPAPTFAADAPNSLSGLELWLPAYQPQLNYADVKFTDALAEQPTVGAVVQSSKDVSPNAFRVTSIDGTFGVLYAEDEEVGASWQFAPPAAATARAMIVGNSNGTIGPNNFDFVQDTGEFTLSTFVKIDQYTGTLMTLFDNINSTTTNPGFSLALQSDGSVRMMIVGADGNVRFNQSSQSGLIASKAWYHLAVVGHGPGQPVTYYITPVQSSAVSSYASGEISGENGEFPTDPTQNLTIGSRMNYLTAFRGQMVDQAIYNRALSNSEIQQLFDFTKKI